MPRFDAEHAADLDALPPPILDRSRHAAPQVLDYLHERIIALDFPPGCALSRSDLAAKFGLSQTPVRDALIRLAEEGLVDVYAQHKTVVSRIDISCARQAHFLRRSVETEIVRTLAGNKDAALVKELRATLARQSAAFDAGDYGEFAIADEAFHKRMYEAAGVPDLYAIVRRYSGHIDRLRRLHLPQPGKAPEILGDHRRIVDAIARGDPDDAASRVRTHLSGTLSWIEKVRVQYPNYVVS